MRKLVYLSSARQDLRDILRYLTQESGNRAVAREVAYASVQSNSMKVWRGEGQFLDFLKADPNVRPHLTDAEMAELFDLGYHFKNVDRVFERVFGAQG